MAGYRNQSLSALLTVTSGVFAGGAIVYALVGRAGWLPMLVVVALAAFTFLRLARAGAFVDDRGVRIVNPLRTVRLPWEELAGFSLRAHGGFPALGFAERRDGSRVGIWGIQARSSSPAARRAPEAAIAALEARLEQERARRTGR